MVGEVEGRMKEEGTEGTRDSGHWTCFNEVLGLEWNLEGRVGHKWGIVLPELEQTAVMKLFIGLGSPGWQPLKMLGHQTLRRHEQLKKPCGLNRMSPTSFYGWTCSPQLMALIWGGCGTFCRWSLARGGEFLGTSLEVYKPSKSWPTFCPVFALDSESHAFSTVVGLTLKLSARTYPSSVTPLFFPSGSWLQQYEKLPRQEAKADQSWEGNSRLKEQNNSCSEI